MNWTLFSIISKIIYLSGSAAVIGGSLSIFLLRDSSAKLINQILHYIVIGGIAGILASGAFFLGQVGEINDAGLNGMLDWSMVRLLADSGMGMSNGLRAIGFLFIFPLVIMQTKLYDERTSSIALRICIAINTLLIIGLIVVSSPLVGHVSTLPPPYRILLSFHFLSVLAWVGSLLPLWLACRISQSNYLHAIMSTYGKVAIIVITVILISGGLIVLELINRPSEFVSSDYGRGLLAKFLGVSLLLLLAARHKFKLVPQLALEHSPKKLKQSIAVECVIAFLVLTATAYTTTAVGPSMAH